MPLVCFRWTLGRNSEITRGVKAYLVQSNPVWEDKLANFDRVRRLVEGVEIVPNSLVVLPEMFATGFSFDLTKTLEPDPSPTQTFLSELAIDHRVTVVGGMVRAGKHSKGRNEAVVIGPSGELMARYCKMHPLTFSGETESHEKGENLVLFEWGGFVASPFICYDLRFPEVFRRSVKRGAELLVIIALWPLSRVEHWTALLTARAIENQAWVIGVNRCGTEPKVEYPGRSQVVDPKGNVVLDAGLTEGIASTEIDRAVLTQWRNEFPALPDMRFDLAD